MLYLVLVQIYDYRLLVFDMHMLYLVLVVVICKCRLGYVENKLEKIYLAGKKKKLEKICSTSRKSSIRKGKTCTLMLLLVNGNRME